MIFKTPTRTSEENDPQLVIVRRNRTTQITYISLFTSLLALFILIISLVDLEPSTPKRNFQKLVTYLYQEMSYQKKQEGLDWLIVENTFAKGVKLSLDPNSFVLSNLFPPARARVNSYYVPYFRRIADFIGTTHLKTFPQKHQKLIREVEAAGYHFMITIRVEGYTDATPLSATALYKDNLQLSTFRAYAVMDLLKIFTGLPESNFSIAGYGDTRPLTDNPMDSENRRVEIYLIPQIIEKDCCFL